MNVLPVIDILKVSVNVFVRDFFTVIPHQQLGFLMKTFDSTALTQMNHWNYSNPFSQ